MTYIGQPISRIDGPAKVTGSAKYAGEFTSPDLAHGVIVSSTIARGRIIRIDPAEAMAVPGVLHVFTHENRSGSALLDRSWRDQVAPPGSPFRPLHGADIRYSGQPVALVVAEDFESARYAASVLRIEYEEEAHATDLAALRGSAYVPPKKRSGIAPPPDPRGDAASAYARAPAKIDAEYVSPYEHHNPMELNATTVVWEDDGKLTVYDKTQGVQNVQAYLTGVFGLKASDVRVVSPYVGGAFGYCLRPQHQVFLAVQAARELKRSVRVTFTRHQMFSTSYRPHTIQTVALGAASDGLLQAITHEAIANTSQFEDYQENVVNWSGLVYGCENATLTYKIAKLDLYTPSDMRAPGAVLGMFAMETAMDELAATLAIDPLALRLRNYSDRDLNEDKPYTSKALRACYEEGAARFGWVRRSHAPRSMREGRELVGWGMATGVWEALQMKTGARAVLTPGPRLEVSNATADIGTGTYTIMAQIAADTLGLPIEAISVKLGDSDLTAAPVEGGSWTAASTGAAVQLACETVREKLFTLARGVAGSPLANADVEHVEFVGGVIRLKSDPTRSVSLDTVVRSTGEGRIEATESAGPDAASQKRFSRNCHSAIFAEVRVDEELNVVRVTRVVNAIAAGRILNLKTARSQILGGVVWGIGMALHEETVADHALGRFMNANLGEYHIPAHADVHDIDVIFVDEPDPEINQLGVKGLGEIGIVGTAAAIGNAIFHATGKRVRDLPITIDKLMV